jgi:hypothetical protein
LAVWLCAWLNCTGWALSALGQLNAAGYAVSLAVGLAALLLGRRKFFRSLNHPAHANDMTLEAFLPLRVGGGDGERAGVRCASHHLEAQGFPAPTIFARCRRFRRPLPAIFLLVAALVFLGGAIYAPTNYDALTYRLPRMLNWWSAGHWFWIPTFNDRMNYSGVAWEWTAMPFLALTRSDRGMFLINALGFLLMPGLLFSIFRQLGMARRVAWTWMWLLPLAYGYATQAGSIGNDLFGTLFCLLSVYFGLRSRKTGRVGDVWLALLAAALMTGVKLSNLPLALPCLVAVWPALKSLLKPLAGSLAVGAMCVLVSALPIMALNQWHTGSWTGDPKNTGKMQVHHPMAAVLGNSFLLAEASFMPLVLPGSHQINDWTLDHLPGSWQRLLKEQFPRIYGNRLNELPAEEGAGLGLGVTLPLCLVLLATAAGFRRWQFSNIALGGWLFSVGLAAWVAFLFYLLKMGSEAGPRLLLPYYPLVIAPLLMLPVHRAWLRHRVWRVTLLLGAACVLPSLIFSPARPLWPAATVTEQWVRNHPGSAFLQRLASIYATYAKRNDVLASVRDRLPPAVREVGFVATSNDTDYSLWRPFGSRRIISLRNESKPGLQVPPGLEWLVVKRTIWPEVCDQPLEEWADAHHAVIMASVPVTTLVSWGAETWCILRVDENGSGTPTPSP